MEIVGVWTAAIRNAEDGTVYKGDKSLGKETYKEFNDTYVPDIIRVTEAPELGEIKNFSPYTSPSSRATSSPPHSTATCTPSATPRSG